MIPSEGDKVMKKKKIFQDLLIGAGVFLTCVLAGFLLICMVYMLPSGRVSLHVQESGAILEQEKDYPQLIPSSPYMVLDNFTDCIMLLTSAYDGEESIADKAINNYRIYQKKATKQVSCKVCGILPEKDAQKISYARYWHGYMVVLKPLLLFLNINEIRQLNQFGILGCICLIGILLYMNRKMKYLIPFLLAVSFLNPGVIMNSLQNSTIFYVSSLAVIVLLACWKRTGFRQYAWLYFMITGMVTSYMDFLTYPVVALAFPLIFYYMLNEDSRFIVTLKRLVGYSVMWCIGYAGMWSSKWVLSSILTGKNYFTNAMESITIRSGNVVGEQTITLSDVYGMLITYLKDSKLWTCTLLFVVLCLVTLVLSSRRWKCWSVSLAFLIISLYPFVWGIGTKNHTYIHHMFTHRGWSVLIFGLSCAVLPMIERPFEVIRKKVFHLDKRK